MNVPGRTGVLLVEDSAVDATLVRGLLRHAGGDPFSVTQARTLAEALRFLGRTDIDLVILDLNLPDSIGLETLRRVVAQSALPIVVLTGADEAVGIQAMREGAQDYLPKGQLQAPLLARSVRYAIERHRASRALRESNESLSRMISSAADAIITKDLQGSIKSWNPAAEKLFGYSVEEVLGKPMLVLFPPELVNEEREILARIEKGDGVEHFESVRIRKDGRALQVALTISPIRDSEGRIIGASKIARDISAQKQAEEQLRRQASLLDQAFDAVLVWERDGTIIFWNQGAVRMYGFSTNEAIGRVSHELLQTSAAEGLEQVFQKLTVKGSWEGELAHTRSDGKRIAVESRMVQITEGERCYVLETNRDVSEERLLEERLRQAQKLEGIGRLAGGVAHDFNNLLGIILGSAELLAESVDLSQVRRRAGEIQKAGQRAANLTKELLAFSRKQVLEVEVTDLNAKVSGIREMLVRMVGEGIEISTSLAANLGRVRADPNQIEQILLNLVMNARDAMPKGGKITIETQNIELKEAYAGTHSAVVPGRYVMIAVSDSGVGMDAETLAHIFEPFFTTKSSGTGLGLATVYGAVKQSGGNIWAYSEPGNGTTFKVYFSRVDGAAESAGGGEYNAVALPKGTETILLVEDSDSLRGVTKEFLQGAGYNVVEARNGDDAVQVARTHKPAIHLLLTDVVMPGMSGRESADEIKRIHPETRILFMSGYTATAIVHRGVLDEGVSLLTKPFTRSGLMQKVHEMLKS
ncbi:MAG TPA: PAS domain S-box protein [Candidatus Saccharimonadales bacterium]|jgi:two-component system cell cycle sensor histidine kinase/response regulator CckA|nr:PAS domain S-box protein [Candidatus Saccharimonadales bacterium]